MSVFSGLFKSRDKPQNRTVGSAYTFYMGSSTSGNCKPSWSSVRNTVIFW